MQERESNSKRTSSESRPTYPETEMTWEQRLQLNADHLRAKLNSTIGGPFSKDESPRKSLRRSEALRFLEEKLERYGLFHSVSSVQINVHLEDQPAVSKGRITLFSRVIGAVRRTAHSGKS